jgi:hypothetical protein
MATWIPRATMLAYISLALRDVRGIFIACIILLCISTIALVVECICHSIGTLPFCRSASAAFEQLSRREQATFMNEYERFTLKWDGVFMNTDLLPTDCDEDFLRVVHNWNARLTHLQ